ncbi:hypothetical protein ABW19_dt0209507 [Dactylella cylindrospora]|nr:hypothetical protein ABW19_dt0209507 [Dactylella cylindrospora]
MASCSTSSGSLLRRSGASLRQAWIKAEASGRATRYSSLLSRRFMATEAALPSSNPPNENESCVKIFEARTPAPRTKRDTLLNPSPVTATIYKFPTLEPIKFEQYDPLFLHLPLRRDILHRAVVYEGHAHRLGRAKTQWRSEVNVSGRKLRPQKGTGKARLGDASSPMLRGGAKAHGPKPRDFKTALPRKVYDLAFRTALSHRYRKGELVIIDGTIQPDHSKTRYMRQILLLNKWGRGDGKTLFITMRKRHNLYCGLNMLSHHGRAMPVEEVDVKDLLEMGRIVIEQHALEWLGEQHGVTFNKPLRTIEKPSRWKENHPVVIGGTSIEVKPAEKEVSAVVADSASNSTEPEAPATESLVAGIPPADATEVEVKPSLESSVPPPQSSPSATAPPA